MGEHCPICDHVVADYSQSHCERCGHHVGWPNYRKALQEQSVLNARYEAACDDLKRQGLGVILDDAEKLAEISRPVIGMDAHVCKDLLIGGKYRSYFRRVEIGDRYIATEENHGNRSMVSGKLYPGYGQNLHYAVLSPDGTGLVSYGSLAVTWGVKPYYLQTRATLLEENEFSFFEKHGLGALGTTVPAGFRATWEDRKKLVVAKVAPRVDRSTARAELPRLLLMQGVDRPSDTFVEVVIYATAGIDSEDVIEVKLLKAFTEPADQRAWDEVKEICNRRGIKVGAVA